MKTSLNVFLLTDLEGVAYVDSIDDMDRTSAHFAHVREKLCTEINLAVSACFEAGATRVYYLDGHAGGGNVVEERIDPRAVKCTVATWKELLENGEIDCLIELGAHARAGTVGGFLDHTLSSKSIYYIKINGVEMSEFSLHAIFCAKYGVPTVAVIGDEVACRQALEYVPDLFTGAVKTADCRNLATTYPNAKEILCDTVKKALKNRHTVSLIPISEPLTVEQAFYRTDMCEEALAHCPPDTVRIDARTLKKTVSTLTAYSELRF